MSFDGVSGFENYNLVSFVYSLRGVVANNLNHVHRATCSGFEHIQLTRLSITARSSVIEVLTDPTSWASIAGSSARRASRPMTDTSQS